MPVAVFNPLNIAREDLVEASVSFPEGMPKEVHVIGPDNNEVAAQISNGKVIFAAKAPSVGYAVYDVLHGAGAPDRYRMKVSGEFSRESVLPREVKRRW